MKISVIKATGLTPVKAKRKAFSHNEGDIFGVSPESFKELYESGAVDPVKVPKDIECTEIDVEVGKPAEPDAPAPVAIKEEGVAIPEDWQTIHFLQRINLAYKISGRSANDGGEKMTDEAATAIIAAEIEKRAAGATE